jgi:hypothetical protein
VAETSGLVLHEARPTPTMIHTFPPMDVVTAAYISAKPYMSPSDNPFAIAAEGYLTKRQCDALLEDVNRLEPVNLGICAAETRDCGFPLPEVYRPVVDFVHKTNGLWWNYHLYPEAAAFHQRYRDGGSYQLHMDGQVGQNRKLTAVVMLSETNAYFGGDLVLHYHPNKFVAPRTRGTIVIFQSWMLHEVTNVVGNRETVNFGFWGPPFK